MDEWIDGWMDGRMNGWKDKQTDRLAGSDLEIDLLAAISRSLRDSHTARWMHPCIHACMN